MSIAQVVSDGVVVNVISVDPLAKVSSDGLKLIPPSGEIDAEPGQTFYMQAGAGIGWTLVGGALVAPVADAPAAPVKADLLAYAADKRFAIETGGITVGPARIETTRDSQSMIANTFAYAAASGAVSVSYKTGSGFVSLDAATIKAIAIAVGAHVQACFSAEETIDGQIASGAVTTFAQIDASTWPAN